MGIEAAEDQFFKFLNCLNLPKTNPQLRNCFKTRLLRKRKIILTRLLLSILKLKLKRMTDIIFIQQTIIAHYRML
jgi:hypothetical protein